MEKRDRRKEGSVGSRQKTHDYLSERERERKSPDFNHKYLIASIGSGTVLWWVCVQNTFATLRFAKAPGKQSREGWEWGVKIRERRKREIERKGERNVNHTLLFWAQHVSISVPARPPAWPPGNLSVCVCVTDRERVCIGQQAYARQCCFVRTCVCVRVCLCELSQRGWKHMGRRAHVAKHTFSHKTVARQRFFSEPASNLCCWSGERLHYLSK